MKIAIIIRGEPARWLDSKVGTIEEAEDRRAFLEAHMTGAKVELVEIEEHEEDD